MGISPRLATGRAVRGPQGALAAIECRDYIPRSFFSCMMELLARSLWWTEFLWGWCSPCSPSSKSLSSMALEAFLSTARVVMLDDCSMILGGEGKIWEVGERSTGRRALGEGNYIGGIGLGLDLLRGTGSSTSLVPKQRPSEAEGPRPYRNTYLRTRTYCHTHRRPVPCTQRQWMDLVTGHKLARAPWGTCMSR